MYAQFTSYPHCNPKPELSLPEKAWTFKLSNEGSAKGITLMYILLQSKDMFTKKKTISLIKWEHKLDVAFMDTQWSQVKKHNFSYAKCTNHMKLSQKTHLRRYLTCSRIAKFSTSGDNLCWHACS